MPGGRRSRPGTGSIRTQASPWNPRLQGLRDGLGRRCVESTQKQNLRLPVEETDNQTSIFDPKRTSGTSTKCYPFLSTWQTGGTHRQQFGTCHELLRTTADVHCMYQAVGSTPNATVL